MRITIWAGVWLSAILWLSGCDTKLEMGSTSVLDGTDYIVLEDKADKKNPDEKTLDNSNPDQISGWGKISFNYPLTGGKNSVQRFDYTFSLDLGGSIGFHSFCRGNLTLGMNFVVARSEDNKLTGKYSVGLLSYEIGEEALESLDKEGAMAIRLIVDNSDVIGRVRVLNSEGTQIFDSADTQVGGRGQSEYWGITLIHAVVTQAENHPLN